MAIIPNNNTPIRILQILTIMNRGGAESMIMNYYRNIDRTKIQFDFLLHRKEKGAFDEEILSLGGKIYKLDPIHPLTYQKYKQNLEEFFKKHSEYSIIHSHINALSFIVLGVAKKTGIKVRISHSHTAIQSEVILNIFKKGVERTTMMKEFIQHLLRQKVRRASTHNFACSKKAGQWLFGETGDFIIINNAIDTSKFIFNPDLKRTIKESLKLSNKRIIGHVGRFSEEKNHFFLIEIFKEILMIENDYHLVLIGGGNLTLKVKKLVDDLNISDKVSFLGIRDDIPNLLQAMDAFVFPSIYEGLPVTLIEAQASGLKIFASKNI